MTSRLLSCLFLSVLVPLCLAQGNQLVIIQTPVTAQRLDGTVRMYFDEQPVPNVHVELCDRAWKHIFASAITNEDGHFHLDRPGNSRTYYIRIYSLGFNISEYTVRLSKHARPELELKISLGT